MLRTPVSAGELLIEPSPISTWFGIGGCAHRLARPRDVGEVRACVEIDSQLRVLGDGANLLVDDDGIDALVLDTRLLNDVQWENDRVAAQAGVNLPWLIVEAVRRGLGGLEGLAGIPASVGGATIMNAGGAFGEMADVVSRVEALDRDGGEITLERDEIAFGYRCSGLNHLVVTQVHLQLTPCPENDASERWRTALRDKLKETMAYKKRTQPMAADSAGCVFKNPTLDVAIPDIGEQGQRVSAGMLIDRAGCGGLCVGGATVSEHHANFIVTHQGAQARDVMQLMALVTQRVVETFGLLLKPELVLWRNDT
jgi:UDP-N-acetylmuramate dehydrogenase